MKRMLVCLALVACAPDYSNGSRVGVVTKLSEKGLIWKSWEGEMNMGGMRTLKQEVGDVESTTAVVNAFTFNVDPMAVPKVQAALSSGQRVELLYRQWAVSPPTIDDDHVVFDVKVSK